MNDYFFEMCDARAELAGSRVTIETLMNAVEGDPVMMKAGRKAIMLEVALKLAKEQIASIDTVLTKEA
jgi:hypothetical protein